MTEFKIEFSLRYSCTRFIKHRLCNISLRNQYFVLLSSHHSLREQVLIPGNFTLEFIEFGKSFGNICLSLIANNEVWPLINRKQWIALCNTLTIAEMNFCDKSGNTSFDLNCFYSRRIPVELQRIRKILNTWSRDDNFRCRWLNK